MNKLMILLFLLLILLSACGTNQVIKKGDVSSTDLQLVSIENFKIGDSIENVDLTKFTQSNDFKSSTNHYTFEDSNSEQKPNVYNFEKLRLITDDEGVIIKIIGDILGYVTAGDASTVDGITYSINGSTLFYTIDEIIDVLGNNYYEYWFDREQSLKAYTYTDKDNNTDLTFVCDDNSKNFV